jgi:MIP family channel proteins
MQPSLTNRILAEICGTFGFFFFGFTAIAAASGGLIESLGVTIGFGGGLALMIFAFGHISGGHFNPAVTTGLAIGGRFPWREVPAYLVAQLVGGVLASLVVGALFTDVSDALVSAAGVSSGEALVLEAIATALFIWVILAVATDDRAAWHGAFAPIAIGGFIFVAANVVGPFTSGSFNPARSLAPAITAGELSDVWIFLVGPVVGAAIGSLIFTYLRRAGTAVEVDEEPLVDRR